MKKFDALKYFVDNFVDRNYRIDLGKIKISRADRYEHNIRVCEICCKLIEEKNTNFICQPRLKRRYGNGRPDIVFNIGNVIYLVEVRYTETDKRSKDKLDKLPEELRDYIVYIDAKKPLEEEMVRLF